MTTRTPTQSPSPGGVQIRPGSVADALGFTNEEDPQRVPTRGEQLASAIRAVLPPEALASARNSIWWQCRKGLYPVAAGGGLWTTAYILHDAGANPWYVPAGALLVGLGGLAIEKVRNWVGKALWRTNWSGGALALAAAWTSAGVQTGVGLDTPMPTLLVLGGSLVAAPWWWFNRPRPQAFPMPTRPVEVEPVAEIEAGPHADQENWDKKIRPRVLKNTALLNREGIEGPDGTPNGSAWIIDGSEENISSGDMFQQLEKIKGAFDRDFSDSLIYIEPSPTGRKTQARLILLERNPLKDVVRWSEPKLDRASGVLPFAVYPDGSGWAKYRMFKPNWGPVHDLFAGGTGSGKTTAMKQLAIESLAMGNAVLLFDPHQGAEFEDSVGFFTETFLNPADIYCGFFGLEEVLDERMGMIPEIGKRNFGPDHGFPIIHAMLDEAKEPLADPDINRIAVRLSTEGRKAWIKFSLALQVPSVENLGAGGGTIREQLTSGNTLLYRITQRITGAMAYQGNLPIDPVDLPELFDNDPDRPTYGLGYVLNGMGRALQSRSMLVEDEMFARWIRRIPQMDERSAEAFRRGINKGLQRMATRRPDLANGQMEVADLSNVTPIRQAESAGLDADAGARVLDYIRARGGEVSMEEIAAVARCGVGTAGLLVGDLAQTGQIQQTATGYTAAAR